MPARRSAAQRLCMLALGRAATALLSAAVLSGCEPHGPPSTTTTNAGMTTLTDRAAFLHKYVTFRRTYETLDFDIAYHDNSGGMVPAPSDWDVRLVATVPAAEIAAWIPAGVQASAAPDTSWMKSIPTSLDTTGVTEWYVDGRRVVGLDRTKRIVAYRVSNH